MGLSGMLCELTLKNHQDIPLFFLFLLAVFIGAFCGFLNGFIVAKLHVYALIATLATKYIFRGVIYLFSGGAWVAQAEMTPEFIAITTVRFLGINSLIWFAAGITILSFVYLNYTSSGRHLFAVGNSQSAAEVTGIRIRLTQIRSFVLCGIIAGLAGLLWVCKYGNAQSESCDGYEISVIASVVAGGCSIAGGEGTVAGVLLGALLMGTLNNILPLIRVSTYWQQAIKGFIILISIVINAAMQKRVKKQELRRREL
ncbi:MAG: ABC transporter permease, partial [Lachnospiraceae bacterium]|nr:ABC transporter permease [Lachnospiraceae bacterium]